MSDGDFLSRWSRRKIEARKGPEAVVPAEAASVPPAVAEIQPTVIPAKAGIQTDPSVQDPPLPPVESLTPESDFLPFMKAEVDPEIKRAALKALFRDPRFNVMDGLDVYIDDYSKADPLPAGWLEKLNQVAHLGDTQRLLAEAEEKAREAAVISAQSEVKSELEQEVAHDSEPHPNGASQLPSPSSESKDC